MPKRIKLKPRESDWVGRKSIPHPMFSVHDRAKRKSQPWDALNVTSAGPAHYDVPTKKNDPTILNLVAMAAQPGPTRR